MTWEIDKPFPPGLRHTPNDVGTYEVQSAEWLDLRQEGIGASDTPSILGAPGAFSTSLKVWAQKVGKALEETISEQTAELFHFGQRMEPLIADELRERSGYDVRPEPRSWPTQRIPLYRRISMGGFVSRVSGVQRSTRMLVLTWRISGMRRCH